MEPNLAPRMILVVEDSDLLHEIYDVVLLRYRLRGAVVLHARDGLDALRLLIAHPEVDLILLDLVMPAMDGLKFLRVRRQNPQLRAIPTVVVTTKGEQHMVAEAMAAGATEVLTKPLHTERLHAEIARLFPEPEP